MLHVSSFSLLIFVVLLQNFQRLAGVVRGHGVLTVMDYLWVSDISPKRRDFNREPQNFFNPLFAPQTQVERPAMTTRGGRLSQRATAFP